MKQKKINTISKKIIVHILVILTIVLMISIIYFLSGLGTEKELSFHIYFLQALTGIILFILPPIYFNIYICIPKLLIKHKYVLYVLALIMVILIWGFIIGYIEPWIDTYWFDQPSEKATLQSGILVMVFIIGISTLLHLSFRWFVQLSKVKQIENDRLTYELSMLKNQIKPHFFFNTLNNLYALALEKAEETPFVILKLSEMLRYTIYDCKAAKVSLAKEVLYIENYIALQTIRHYNRGKIVFNKSISNPSIKIAPMILIVFIENAFKHGYEKMDQNAFLDVTLTTSETEVSLIVKNNYDPAQHQSNDGLGLNNVKRRLSLLYPNQNELSLSNKNNQYTAALKINL
ncbi:histidine kinase [Aquimarina sp. AD10]|nr:histidine kinase [Aquimarina sp. AD10]RKM97560.1 histidine kinase [Aquimarina sp. AD10]